MKAVACNTTRTIKGLFRDLRRHLERAWTQYTGTDPYAGDVWRVELLDLQSNGSRRWPATEGTVDFGAIELPWLREVTQGLGPQHQALPARTAAGAAGLPGRLPNAGGHRVHRPGSPERR